MFKMGESCTHCQRFYIRCHAGKVGSLIRDDICLFFELLSNWRREFGQGFAGPLAVMAALPALALLAGFALNTGPEWLIAAWTPLAPAAAWLQRRAGGGRPSALALLAATLATGLWARALLAGVAVSAGAEPAPAALLAQLLAPGMALDGAAFAAGWFVCRALGREPRSLEPGEAGF